MQLQLLQATDEPWGMGVCCVLQHTINTHGMQGRSMVVQLVVLCPCSLADAAGVGQTAAWATSRLPARRQSLSAVLQYLTRDGLPAPVQRTSLSFSNAFYSLKQSGSRKERAAGVIDCLVCKVCCSSAESVHAVQGAQALLPSLRRQRPTATLCCS